MSRVALFFDGKNHMNDVRRSHPDRWIDHARLASWVVERVGGDRLAVSHYYTGVPSSSEDGGSGRALEDLLRDLERIPGFFVHRFPRMSTANVCSKCGHEDSFTREKMVDTSLVADLISLAAQNAYDTAVVFSGDADFAPGLDAVHRLGKKVWIATFGGAHLSRSLQKAAWGTVDLSRELDAFSAGAPTATPGVAADPSALDAEILRELRRAELHFGAMGGFVGSHYFLNRWRGHAISDDANDRRVSIERLMSAGLVEGYEVEGRAALRVAGQVPLPEDLAPPDPEPAPLAHAK